MKSGEGELVLHHLSHPPTVSTAVDFMPCQYCLNFVYKKHLHSHARRCMFAPEGVLPADYVKGCKALLVQICNTAKPSSETPSAESDKPETATVTPESIKQSCGDDYLLGMFADSLLDKLVSKDEQTSSNMTIVQSRLKSVSNLLDVLNKDKSLSKDLSYFICGARFNEVTEAVKVMPSQTRSNNIVISIGLCLQKIVLLKISHGIEKNNSQAESEGNEFKELMRTQWNLKVISKVKERKSVGESSTQDGLPPPEDLLKLMAWSKEQCNKMMEVSMSPVNCSHFEI